MKTIDTPTPLSPSHQGSSLRPHFHFTSPKGWLNDPNGLVWLEGEWHLFYQHNPFGNEWGNMTWAHAVSSDLLHWRTLPHAIEINEHGHIYSGSALIDKDNRAGFGANAMVALYTAAGSHLPEGRKKPLTQCLAYSLDRGRTFSEFQGNPVLPKIPEDIGGNRDPRIFYYEPGGHFVMILYVGLVDGDRKNEKGESAVQHFNYIYTSGDLKEWTFASKLQAFYECPELIELPIENSVSEKKWVLLGAPGDYLAGDFDGKNFVPGTDGGKLDFGPHFYAAQCWFGGGPGDARRILIPWMRGGSYPGMDFNQQMGFPTALALRRTKEGLRIVRRPVREIESVWREAGSFGPQRLEDGNLLENIRGEAFDLELEAAWDPSAELIFSVRGATFSFYGDEMSHAGHSMKIVTEEDRLKLRFLVDTTSVEVFAQDGLFCFSTCFIPEKKSPDLSLTGSVDLISAHIREVVL